MNLTVHRNDLLAAVTTAKSVVQARTTIPILACLRLKSAGADRIIVEGCDLTRHVTDTAPAAIHTPGDIAIPADLFASICKALPEQDVTIAIDADTLRATVKAGRARYAMQCLAGDDFPSLMPDSAPASTLRLPASAVRNLISGAVFATCDDDTRYYMSGCFLRVDAATLRSDATDGHRLLSRSVTMAAPTDPGAMSGGIIVPRETCAELGDICAGDAMITMAVHPSSVVITAGDRVMASKLVEGSFPDVGRVVPAIGAPNSVTCGRDDLIKSIHRIAAVIESKVPAIRLKTSPGALTIFGKRDGGVHESEDAIDAVVAGSSDQGVNARYLVEHLQSMSGSKVTLETGDGRSPYRLIDDGAPDDIHVIMPMNY